tara:strand:+ start:649 stop:792 length:144 start_codon:yes stop_codon:yes gene_type:complete
MSFTEAWLTLEALAFVLGMGAAVIPAQEPSSASADSEYESLKTDERR